MPDGREEGMPVLRPFEKMGCGVTAFSAVMPFGGSM
jgi:hypothetical protein